MVTPFELGRTRSAMLVQLAAVALLAGGVGVGVASFLPAYLGGVSLAAQPDQATAHALPLAGFALAAVLAVFARPPAGSGRAPLGLPGVLGLGVAALDLGLVVTDIGQAAAGATAGDGLVLAILEWALCAAGSLLALHPSLLRPERRSARRPGRADVVGAVLFGVVGLAVAGLFAPAWDRYVVDLTAVGRVTTFTAGNAFAEPGVMIAGSVLVMVGVAAVAVVAGVLRQAKVAATLVGGAFVVLVGQVASALVQWRIPLPPSQLGLSPQRAAALGLRVEAGFTAAFYLFCVFAALLGLLAVVRLTAGSLPRLSRAVPVGGATAGPFGGPADVPPPTGHQAWHAAPPPPGPPAQAGDPWWDAPPPPAAGAAVPAPGGAAAWPGAASWPPPAPMAPPAGPPVAPPGSLPTGWVAGEDAPTLPEPVASPAPPAPPAPPSAEAPRRRNRFTPHY